MQAPRNLVLPHPDPFETAVERPFVTVVHYSCATSASRPDLALLR